MSLILNIESSDRKYIEAFTVALETVSCHPDYDTFKWKLENQYWTSSHGIWSDVYAREDIERQMKRVNELLQSDFPHSTLRVKLSRSLDTGIPLPSSFGYIDGSTTIGKDESTKEDWTAVEAFNEKWKNAHCR